MSVRSILRPPLAACTLLLPLLAVSPVVSAEVALPTGFQNEMVVGGLSQPSSFDFLPDGRVLIAEKTSDNVRLWVPGETTTSTILTVPNVRHTGFGELGLLSVVVDSKWPERPFIYVYYDFSFSLIDVRVTRYELSGALSDGTSSNLSLVGGSELHILTGIPDLRQNHNGGTLRFGLDDMLYLSVGDDEDKCAAQNIDRLEGKILRMDVSGIPAGAQSPPTLAEITPADNPYIGGTDIAGVVWAVGLRNPFQMHIDEFDGSVLVADVGWRDVEEVSQGIGPGVNFGWPYYEGTLHHTTATNGSILQCPEPAAFAPEMPMHDYDRTLFGGSASVIGAGTYRAPVGVQKMDNPWPAEYEGDYFYTDYYRGWLVRLTGGPGAWQVAPMVAGQPNADHWATGLHTPVDFQVGADGSLWYLSHSGGLLNRIVRPAVPVEPSSFGALKARFDESADEETPKP